MKAEMNRSEEIERLRERCEGYKGQVLTGSIEIDRLRARIAELLTEIDDWHDAAQMSGPVPMGWDRSRLERCRQKYIIAKAKGRK